MCYGLRAVVLEPVKRLRMLFNVYINTSTSTPTQVRVRHLKNQLTTLTLQNFTQNIETHTIHIMPRYAHGFHRRNVITVRNPSNRSRFAVNHNISILLENLRKELRFASTTGLKRWLSSDEVQPYWREFKRDLLSQYTNTTAMIALRSATPTAVVTRRRREINRRFNGDLVMRILADDRKLDRLRRTVTAKRLWGFNCHAAWFVAGVYGRFCRNQSSESMFPIVRVTHSRRGMYLDLLVVLMTLVRVEERQPGWGDEEYEED
jgi:hypothetical protein